MFECNYLAVITFLSVFQTGFKTHNSFCIPMIFNWGDMRAFQGYCPHSHMELPHAPHAQPDWEGLCHECGLLPALGLPDKAGRREHSCCNPSRPILLGELSHLPLCPRWAGLQEEQPLPTALKGSDKCMHFYYSHFLIWPCMRHAGAPLPGFSSSNQTQAENHGYGHLGCFLHWAIELYY